MESEHFSLFTLVLSRTRDEYVLTCYTCGLYTHAGSSSYCGSLSLIVGVHDAYTRAVYPL